MGSYINQHVLNNLFYILVSVFVFYFIYDHGRYLKSEHYTEMLFLLFAWGFRSFYA